MTFKRDQILFLIGAGASMDAGLPDSNTMISKVESLLDNQWSEYKSLYDYIKSSILFGDGIRGVYGEHHYNIERLVNTLDELIKKEEHPLYPFVGSWNPKLNEVTDHTFEKRSEFRAKIVKELRTNWVELNRIQKASYFANLENFQKSFEHPLRVFTLNYDLCIENTCKNIEIQRGFNEDREWDWRLFEDNKNDDTGIFLYKLHGSTDWERHPDKNLTYLDSTSSINDEDAAIIFGTSYKLQYIDPFLFFAYEFRKWTLDSAKVIIALGYGFGDEHINGILKQALENDPERKIISVNPEKKEVHSKKIKKSLNLKSDKQLIFETYKAKDYLENHLCLERIKEYFPTLEEKALF